MNFVNIDGMKSAINRNNAYYESFLKEVKDLNDIINDLSNLYSGSSLSYLFDDVTSQTKKINMLPGMIKNYSNLLIDVRASYIAQQDNIISLLSKDASNTNM